MSLKSADVDTVSPSQNQRGLPLRPSHHGQEARLLRWIVAEHAGKAAGERHRAMLGDAAHRHAGMLRLDHHCNAPRFENFVIAAAIWAVRCSWVCRRRAKISV